MFLVLFPDSEISIIFLGFPSDFSGNDFLEFMISRFSMDFQWISGISVGFPEFFEIPRNVPGLIFRISGISILFLGFPRISRIFWNSMGLLIF